MMSFALAIPRWERAAALIAHRSDPAGGLPPRRRLRGSVHGLPQGRIKRPALAREGPFAVGVEAMARSQARFDGKVAFVTGGGTGIGFACMRAMQKVDTARVTVIAAYVPGTPNTATESPPKTSKI